VTQGTCPEGSGYYSAVKAAIEALTLSLRKEVAPLGVTAIVVEPGAFRTDFAGRSLTQAAAPIADTPIPQASAARNTRPRAAPNQATTPRPQLLSSATTHPMASGPPSTPRAAVGGWEHVSRSTDLDA
jgi:NAD(P)-dependent dehydrogenase (short-subunit alcohol dehydrogenase family)